MNLNIDNITLIFLLISTIFFLYRYYLKIKTWGTVQVFGIMQLVAILWIGLSQLMLQFDILNYTVYVQIEKSCLALVYSLFLGLIGLSTIENYTAKKIKTLWKTPLLGLFAGMLLEMRYVYLLSFGFFAISLYLLFKDRKFRFLLRKFISLSPAVVSMFFLKPGDLFLLNGILLWIVILGADILNTTHVSSLLRPKVIE